MPLVALNASPLGIRLHDATGDLDARLQEALAGDGPIIVMIHGYKFSPGWGRACPHAHILSLTPRAGCWKAASWPGRLGICNEGEGAAAIAFGWHARGLIWDVYRRAESVARDLAHLLLRLREIAPHRPVHALAHSLGARIVLAALPHLPANALRRAVLLNAADYAGTAVRALQCPAGRAVELISVTSRENDIFDFLLERLISPPECGDMALGIAMPESDNTLSLQLDHYDTLDALARFGFVIAPPDAHISHWSTYLRPGVFRLYRALFGLEGDITLSELRAALPREGDRRWSRLIQRGREFRNAAPAATPCQAGSPLPSGRIISTIAQ